MLDSWYTKDPSVFHPKLWPESGASLQDIRAHYLSTDSDQQVLDVASEQWYIKNPSHSQRKGLCAICCHVDWAWLLRNPRLGWSHGPILILRNMIASREKCAFCRLAVHALCTAKGQNLDVTELEEGDVVLGCWIRCEGTESFRTLSLFRRHIGVSTGGIVGYGAFIQEIGIGRFGRRIPPQGADLKLLKEWISRCEDQHSSSETRDYLRYEAHLWKAKWHDLRVIDVENTCVVTTEWNVRYVALSYVWGRVDQLQAIIANVHELAQKDSLLQEKYRKCLPKTIRDAITLVTRVGERYLWVDALSIIQDHPEKDAQLQAMDDVCNGAAWCLVAASATDANSPLPRMVTEGISVGKGVQHTDMVQGTKLAVVLPDLPTALETCTWNTRAWTYQEGVLSRRLVLFCDSQAYFNCYHGYTFCEDIAFEQSGRAGTGNSQISGQILVVDGQTNFEIYAEAVSAYSARNISFHEDAIKAFSGVLSVLKTLFRGDFLCGLPDTELDQALLWYPSSSVIRRRSANGKDLFPTWSWAGWIGEVRYWPNLALSRVRWKDTPTGEYFTSNRFRRPYTATDSESWYKDDWIEGNPRIKPKEQ